MIWHRPVYSVQFLNILGGYFLGNGFMAYLFAQQQQQHRMFIWLKYL